MDLIVKLASSLTSDQKIADGVTGIPDNWPVESYPYTGNVPDGFEQMTDVDMQALKDNNQAAYDAWLQALRPITPTSQSVTISNVPVVTTQFELKDKTLKLVSSSQVVDSNGQAILLIKIPGAPNLTGDQTLPGRFLSAGMAWFSSPANDDRVAGVYFTDEDNLLGQGVGFVVGSYTEDELDTAFKGWYIPQPRNYMECESIGFYGFAAAGFYIKIIGQSGNGFVEGKKFYMNLEWGKKE